MAGSACELFYLITSRCPRGVRKEDLKLDEWLRPLAPSTELRKWFGHDPEKWDEFRRRYFQDLDDRSSEKVENRADRGCYVVRKVLR